MKSEIAQIAKDTMLGLREGVGAVRTAEFNAYIDKLIEAKEKSLDISMIQSPMLSDRVSIGMEGSVSSEKTSDFSGSGEIGGSVLGFGLKLNMSGSRGDRMQEGVRVKADMEFMSTNALDLNRLAELSVDDLKKLRLVDGKPDEIE